MQTQVQCPMCDFGLNHHEIHNKEKGNTHIYLCEACPFIGLEYVNGQDLDNLKEIIELPYA